MPLGGNCFCAAALLKALLGDGTGRGQTKLGADDGREGCDHAPISRGGGITRERERKRERVCRDRERKRESRDRERGERKGDDWRRGKSGPKVSAVKDVQRFFFVSIKLSAGFKHTVFL